jgi:hypothetical protein
MRKEKDKRNDLNISKSLEMEKKYKKIKEKLASNKRCIICLERIIQTRTGISLLTLSKEASDEEIRSRFFFTPVKKEKDGAILTVYDFINIPIMAKVEEYIVLIKKRNELKEKLRKTKLIIESIKEESKAISSNQEI